MFLHHHPLSLMDAAAVGSLPDAAKLYQPTINPYSGTFPLITVPIAALSEHINKSKQKRSGHGPTESTDTYSLECAKVERD